MKAIRRDKPPPQPAGLSRCDYATLCRWQDEDFKYPPYQFKEQYLIWDDEMQSARLLCSTERELLMGYGRDHTVYCYSASQTKQNKQLYEDERCTGIGDSFSIFSFAYFAACAVQQWITIKQVAVLNNRMGLPPGSGLHISIPCPLSKQDTYGVFRWQEWSTSSLHAYLALRTNHTGSDIRISSGQLMNPRHSQRQSINPKWWRWEPIFHCKWQTAEHINPLEARAIMLALFWKARQGSAFNKRVFHVTDSYVCQSIFSKGRTSSKMIQPIIRRANALLMASFLYLYLSHVDSIENPTDEASRFD